MTNDQRAAASKLSAAHRELNRALTAAHAAGFAFTIDVVEGQSAGQRRRLPILLIEANLPDERGG